MPKDVIAFILDHILASAATNGAVVTWNLNKSSRSKQGNMCPEYNHSWEFIP